MVSGTRKKYNSALEHLKGMRGSIPDHHLFQTNLDAFVETSRNVTFVMQNEYDKRSGFNEWYLSKRELMEQDPLFPFFNDKRVTSVHKKPIDTILSGTICVGLSYTIAGQLSESASQESENHNSIATTEYCRNFEDQPEGYSKKEVISLCEDYAIKLGSLVDECEAKFP